MIAAPWKWPQLRKPCLPPLPAFPPVPQASILRGKHDIVWATLEEERAVGSLYRAGGGCDRCTGRYPSFHSPDTQAGAALEQAAAVPAGQLARVLPALPAKEADAARFAKDVEAANAALEDAHEAQAKSREVLDKLDAVCAGRGASLR